MRELRESCVSYFFEDSNDDVHVAMGHLASNDNDDDDGSDEEDIFNHSDCSSSLDTLSFKIRNVVPVMMRCAHTHPWTRNVRHDVRQEDTNSEQLCTKNYG